MHSVRSYVTGGVPPSVTHGDVAGRVSDKEFLQHTG